jgi:hypothetical protein
MRKPIRPADRLAQPRQSRRLLRAATAAPLAASQTGHACVGWSLPHRSRRAVVAKYAVWGVDSSCKRSSFRRETCRSRASESMINSDLSRPPRRLWHVYYRGCQKLRLYLWNMLLRYQVLDNTAVATRRRQVRGTGLASVAARKE